MNVAFLIGYLGADPEVREAGQSKVCSFNIATTHRYKDGDGKQVEESTWHRIQVWGPMGKACHEHLAKGRQVAVQGRIRHTQWKDKEGNEKRGSEILATQVQFLGAKPKGEKDSAGADW